MPNALRRTLYSLGLGTLLFLLNQIAALSGWISPPQGYEPTFFVTCADVPQYLTWIEAARTDWLLPNYHMYQPTEPGLFHPVIALTGHVAALAGWSSGAAFYLLSYIVSVATAAAWLWMLSVFCQTATQRWVAAVVTVCAIPLKLLLYPLATLAGIPNLFFVTGMIEYGVITSDGLLRGGLGAFVSSGMALMMVSVTLAALYLRTGRYYWAMLIAVFLNALTHPFEPPVTISAIACAILFASKSDGGWSRKILPIVGLGVAGILGLLPYVITTLRYEWVAEVARRNVTELVAPGWIFFVYGIPALAVPYLLLVGARPKLSSDWLLMFWFIAPVVLMYVPKMPFAMHLYFGYPYAVGILATRLLSVHPRLALLVRSRLAPKIIAGGVAALSLAGLASFYVRLAQDGRAADPELFTSSVRTHAQREILDWMAMHSQPGDVVLAPTELAAWMATMLRRAPASHDIFSGPSFTADRAAIDSILAKGADNPELTLQVLSRFGPRFVIAPATSGAAAYLASHGAMRHQAGDIQIFETAEGERRPRLAAQ